jgi:hypothetical protein
LYLSKKTAEAIILQKFSSDAVQEFSSKASEIKRRLSCIKGFLKIAMKGPEFDMS